MRGAPPLFVALAIGAVVGCSDDTAPAAGGGPSTTAPDAGSGGACNDGERAVADGCEPVLPDTPCAAGTRAELGSATCVPVGPPSCPGGFEKDDSGWGCMPVLPTSACTGATRDTLGSKTCAPIGDCSAPFPPPNAAVFVDASFTDAQVDATHVKTIAAGITAATSGATIAIAQGTYAENVVITKNVTLVGRCAEKVVIDAPTTDAGMALESGKATIRGITVRGGATGVSAVGVGTEMTIEDVLLDANIRAGIDAFEEAKVTARRIVIRGTKTAAAASITNGIFADVASMVLFEDSAVIGAADAGIGTTGSSTIRLVRSVVRDTIPRPDGVGGAGARGFERGKIELVESAIVASRGTGIIVGTTRASLKMERSTITATKIDERFGGGAIAISAIDEASVDVAASTIADNPSAAFVIRKPGTKAVIKDTAIVRTTGGGEAGAGTALLVKDGATATLDNSVVLEAAFDALQSSSPGTKLTISRSLVASTQPSTGSPKIPAGSGGTALAVVRGGSAVVTSSTIDDAREGALAAGNEGSTLAVDGTLVRGTKTNGKGQFGHGVLALVGARLTLSRCVVDGSAGIGVVFSGASGAVSRTSIRRNAIGIHTQQGSSLLEAAEIPDPLEAGTVVVTPDSRFTENESKLGSGEVPLPAIVPAL